MGKGWYGVFGCIKGVGSRGDFLALDYSIDLKHLSQGMWGMKKEVIVYIGFILGAVLIALVVYIGTLRGELGLSEVVLSVVALLFVAVSYYVYMRLPQFRELGRRLQAIAAENRKLREDNRVLREQVELFKSVEK